MTQQVYERTVHVWAIPHVITVYQKSEAVWLAVGDYRGKRIEANGSSADVAANYWADAARFIAANFNKSVSLTLAMRVTVQSAFCF
jgi:hypothetical protein